MTYEDKQIIKELIEVIETDILNGNGSSALIKLSKIKEKLYPKNISMEPEQGSPYNRFDSDELYDRW